MAQDKDRGRPTQGGRPDTEYQSGREGGQKSGQDPTRQQSSGQIGDGPADRLGEVLPCELILLLLDCPDPDHEARGAIIAVDLQQAVG